MLARIPKDDAKTIAKEESDDHGYRGTIENAEEVTVVSVWELERCQRISNKKDKNYLYQYVRDEGAAKHVLQPIDDGILIVTDANRKIIFASFETLRDAMFSRETTDLLARGLDMWSFFVPLPFSELKQQVVDSWARKIHPELNPERAKVGGLPAAKMAVAHYGCWSMQTDPHCYLVIRTADSQCAQVYPLARVSPAAGLPSGISEGRPRQDARDHPVFSYHPWTLVSTKNTRHKDSCDFFKGVASLCTFGDYTGLPEPAGKEKKKKKKKEAAMQQNLPCINTGHDEDDLQTNQELHRPGALPLNSSSSSASAGSAENRPY
ncbi:hypothetical protein DL768_008024 [Monosporascus sp. mg162]|nr:hypothetical protein DL768_008024 [Monosporascus sp. mg162]